MIFQKLICTALFAAVSLSSSLGFAGVIRQESGTSKMSLSGVSAGQSFTAQDAQLDAIEIYYEDFRRYPSGSAVATLKLFEGAGPSGTLITTLARDFNGVNGDARFDISGVTLIPGDTYTFQISAASGNGYIFYSTANPYSGGTYYSLNTPRPNNDLFFRVFGSGSSTGDPSCSVVNNNDGTHTISCDDGTSTTVLDGQDGNDGQNGTNGQDGDSCTVADNGDGTQTISCDDGTSVTLTGGSGGANGADGANGSDGADGADGSSCTVMDNGDGSKTIACDDGSTATIQDGKDGMDGEDGAGGSGNGQGCSVEQQADGSAVITCLDGTTAMVDAGQNGDGGGCSTAAGSTPSPAWMLLVGLGGFFLKRRRVA